MPQYYSNMLSPSSYSAKSIAARNELIWSKSGDSWTTTSSASIGTGCDISANAGQVSPRQTPRYQSRNQLLVGKGTSASAVSQQESATTATSTPRLVTPRLPRGVSKIPHLVNSKGRSNNIIGNNTYQLHESKKEDEHDESDSLNKSRYLTFSKDQATSHFKTLREELSGTNKSDRHKQNESSLGSLHPSRDITKANDSIQIDLPVTKRPGPEQPPTPLERQSVIKANTKSSAKKSDDRKLTRTIDNADIEQINNLPSLNDLVDQHLNQSRQQPTFEAFIMTGQSMLKLSCNESENNNITCNNNISKLTKQISESSKTKSLNKIDSCEVSSTSTNCVYQRQQTSQSNDKILDEVRETFGKINSNINNTKHTNDSVNDLTLAQDTEVWITSTSKKQKHQQQLIKETPAQTSTIATEASVLIENEPSCYMPYIENEKNSDTSDNDGPNIHQAASNLACRQQISTTASTSATTTELNPHISDFKGPHEKQEIEISNRLDFSELKKSTNYRYKDNSNQMQSFICIDPYNLGDKSTNPSHRGELKLEVENNHSESNRSNKLTQQELQDDLTLRNNQVILDSSHVATDVCDSQTNVSEIAEQKEDMIEETVNMTKQQQLHNAYLQSISSSGASSKDREPAKRLAKRLYNLSGLKKSDVCHHLVKQNPFSQMVAEEYLNLFDFKTMKLDAALRKFLSKLVLNGETQERERMLSQFSHRYYDCNKGKFPSADCVQTLVCAMILLNSDLHAPHSKKFKRSKLSLDAFIDGLNNSVAAQCMEQDSSYGSNGPSSAVPYTFPRSLLIHLYESIKKRPLKCGSDDKCDMTLMEAELDKIYNLHAGRDKFNTLPTRRFAPGQNAPSTTLTASSRRHFKLGLYKMNGSGVSQMNTSQDDSESIIQFKSGYLNRKRVLERHGKPTSKGRRGWRRVYVMLQDLRMVIQLGGDVQQDGNLNVGNATTKETAKRTRAHIVAQNMKNAIRIHHTFAIKSTTYTKREYVFHLRLPDQSEFLMQASSEQELDSWVDTINFAAACLSSPALPSAVSNSRSQQQKVSHKPILPMAYTKLSYWEQLINHEDHLQHLKIELDDHLSEASTTKNANKRYKTEFIEKIAHLKHEIERYTAYVDLMRKKSNSPEAIVLSKHPHIASLTPSDEMIKSLPSFAAQPRAAMLEVPNSVAE